MGTSAAKQSRHTNKSNMLQTLQIIHGHWRWILALVALVLIVKYILTAVQKSKFEGIDVTLGRVFAGVMTIQFLLGMINMVARLTGATGAMYRQAWEHVFTGIIALGLSHMLVPIARKRGALFGLIIAAVTLGLMVLNVVTVRGTWFYSQ
jgi:hypothetical protein